MWFFETVSLYLLLTVTGKNMPIKTQLFFLEYVKCITHLVQYPIYLIGTAFSIQYIKMEHPSVSNMPK